MTEIKDIFAGAEDQISKDEDSEIKMFLENLVDLKFEKELNDDDRSTVFNYAGYAMRNLLRAKQMKCEDCVEMISPNVKTFDKESADEEYSAMINRGGLRKPSDIVFVTCLHAFAMWCYIRDDNKIFVSFMNSRNQRTTFNECFIRKITELNTTQSISNAKCAKNHPYKPLLRRISTSVFNCIAVNFTNEKNSDIHDMKKRKNSKANPSSTERKIQKLTSGSSTATSAWVKAKKVDEPAPPKTDDCGVCKYCKDKKKFGGNGKLKKRCVNKEKNKELIPYCFFLPLMFI